jgi:hypothetical protein
MQILINGAEPPSKELYVKPKTIVSDGSTEF